MNVFVWFEEIYHLVLCKSFAWFQVTHGVLEHFSNQDLLNDFQCGRLKTFADLEAAYKANETEGHDLKPYRLWQKKQEKVLVVGHDFRMIFLS